MKPDCANDCTTPFQFPKRIDNRPGLSHIDYRIGTYSDFKEAILRDLNKNQVLQAWTHRGADDPGIALLEGASILGDILTFYQELYANEAYLRTAQWRESISDLVRLLGYRLSPGVGGQATFAFEIKGDQPVVIPVGFPVKAQLEDVDQPAEFETIRKVIAYPALSKFHLYRPRCALQPIMAGLNQLEVQSVNGLNDMSSINALEIKQGDRLILVPDATMFDVTGTAYTAQKKAEILIVSEVQQILDRTVITFEGTLTESRGVQVKAYRLGHTFRHFGQNAPAQLTKFNVSTQSVEQEPTSFVREIYGTHSPSSSNADFYSTIFSTEMPLDQEVDDLAEGGKLICQGWTSFDGQSTPVRFTVVKTIESVEPDSLVWGNLSGGSTVVIVDSKLIANNNIFNEKSDIRKLRFHEVTSSEMMLQAPTTWNTGPFTNKILNYFGTYDEVVALAGRNLLFKGDNGTTLGVTVTTAKGDISLAGKDKIHRWLWPVAIDRKPDPFMLEDFDEQNPKATIYGNLAEADQGKSEREAVLGNGDSRQQFQTFKLPKAPLTYHNSVGETPPEVPELEIYVNNRLWTHVSSFFNREPDEEIYIVREDANGDSWVQFGDGNTGKRLPSGVKNVVAKFRTGNGAYGPLKEETTPQAGAKLDRLAKIQLPGIASGGDEAETGDNAREAAPGKIQSLDRLVSLQDFESETLAIPGVSKVRAVWELVDNTPTIVLTVLMKTGREKEIEQIREIVADYNRCRGPQRFPVRVEQGHLNYVYLVAQYAYDPTYRKEVVEAAIKEALGLTGAEDDGIEGSEGLFALDQRRFGQDEYATRITGIIQNVDGVLWSKVGHLGPLGEEEDPSELSLPAVPVFNASISCSNQQILSLYIDHLQLSAVSVPPTKEC